MTLTLANVSHEAEPCLLIVSGIVETVQELRLNTALQLDKENKILCQDALKNTFLKRSSTYGVREGSKLYDVTQEKKFAQPNICQMSLSIEK